MNRLIINCQTKEEKSIALTPEEVTQLQLAQQEYEQEQAKPKPPTQEEYLIDLDFRLCMVELGL